jgi:hypothetical protein
MWVTALVGACVLAVVGALPHGGQPLDLAHFETLPGDVRVGKCANASAAADLCVSFTSHNRYGLPVSLVRVCAAAAASSSGEGGFRSFGAVPCSCAAAIVSRVMRCGVCLRTLNALCTRMPSLSWPLQPCVSRRTPSKEGRTSVELSCGHAVVGGRVGAAVTCCDLVDTTVERAAAHYGGKVESIDCRAVRVRVRRVLRAVLMCACSCGPPQALRRAADSRRSVPLPRAVPSRVDGARSLVQGEAQ